MNRLPHSHRRPVQQNSVARDSLSERSSSLVGMTRRQSLATLGAAAGAGSGSLTFAQERLPRVGVGTAKRVIMIFNCGAPSHHDLWDPKPEADSSVRGEFRTIDTAVPGIQVTEMLPQMARRMDKLAIVRSVHHRHASHNAGMYWSIAGRPYRIDSTLINPSSTDIPSFGTLIGWLAQREGAVRGVPPYVITPKPHCDSFVYLTPGQFGGCLGVKYDPFVVNDDPNSPNFQVRDLTLSAGMTLERLHDRLNVLRQLEGHSSATFAAMGVERDTFHREAARVVVQGDAGRAFDLSQESAEMRERYGRHSWGQSHLLARRLIEAGTRFVATVNGPSIIWDTHDNNFPRLKNTLVPPMEQAFAALLDDLEDRGLLDETLVVWLGDFGRTPKINQNAGRDHWPGCYSVVLAGGGIRGGRVVGASDKIGAYPETRPVSPADIHATVFRALGYDLRGITYHSADGRPVPLTEGTPIDELLA